MKKLLWRLLKKIDDILFSDAVSTIIAAVEVILATYLLLEVMIWLAGWLTW